MATAPVLPGGFELPLEPRLPRLGSVDAVALEERAAALATRSIKRESKVFALELAVRVLVRIQTKHVGGLAEGVEDVMRAQARKRVVLKITPERTASWDHGKLAGQY